MCMKCMFAPLMMQCHRDLLLHWLLKLKLWNSNRRNLFISKGFVHFNTLPLCKQWFTIVSMLSYNLTDTFVYIPKLDTMHILAAHWHSHPVLVHIILAPHLYMEPLHHTDIYSQSWTTLPKLTCRTWIALASHNLDLISLFSPCSSYVLLTHCSLDGAIKLTLFTNHCHKSKLWRRDVIIFPKPSCRIFIELTKGTGDRSLPALFVCSSMANV